MPIFMKIDGIDGDVTDEDHVGEIAVLSYKWGVTQSGSPVQGGGGGAGKSTFGDLVFVKTLDKASPKLMLACASGQHIKEALLTANTGGEVRREFFEIRLSDVVISSFQESGEASDTNIQQEVALAYAKIEYSFTPLRPDGSLGSPEKAGWDLKAGRPV